MYVCMYVHICMYVKDKHVYIHIEVVQLYQLRQSAEILEPDANSTEIKKFPISASVKTICSICPHKCEIINKYSCIHCYTIANKKHYYTSISYI